ncbi:amidase domain-containing protein [Agromyces laixinhei]|uniref:amidase domain-containing protein n=1 Tax=Agromyces laixinhei TaxID=2585717 RepID=UPI0011179B0B|nr:amidase domain-containing protein [Agromyces laixinhei]
MPHSTETRETRRRRTLIAAAIAGVVLVAGGATIAWSAWQGAIGSAAESASGFTTTEVDRAEASGTEVADFSAYSDSVAAQLAYAHEHWADTESETYGYLDENDCVNFTSQTLLARGWVEDDEWWFDESGDAYSHADAWISSTALRDYLESHPERATVLTDDERSSVKVGDIVQFDWDDSGDRDHTGIVTAVETDAAGEVTILYAGHTDPTWDRSVDFAITELHPGGVAYYWSIPE